MTKLHYFSATLLTMAMVSTTVSAALVVIVNPANSAEISTENIKSLFFGKQKSFSDDKTAIVLSLKESDSVRSDFNTKVLDRSDSQMKAYWSKLLFTGKGSPPQEVSIEEMLELVASNPNTIGFIDSTKVTADVKVIATF